MRVQSFAWPVTHLAAAVLLLACSSNHLGRAPDEDGSVPLDASDSSLDASSCGASLSEHADFDAAPLPSWCAEANAFGAGKSTNACDGYLAVRVGNGVDCHAVFLFSAETRQLVARLDECNGAFECTAGPADFVFPSRDCLLGGFEFGGNDCPHDAGADSDAD